ncbi:MAG: SDR family oxidoreductase [Polyangiaceae bacterium]
MDIRGRGALVTGGSRGLGRALAIELAKRGARVVLTARGEAELERVAEEIRAQGGEAHAFAGDVADKRFVHPLAAAATALVGDLDIVIHNASTLGPLPMPALLDTECEDFSAVLEANLIGPMRLTRVIAANMALRNHGVVVFLSSDAAVSAYPNWGAYGVSKAALDHLSRTFAAELGDAGVRFFSVDPGEMNTKMHADALPDADVKTLADPAEIARRIVRMIESDSGAPNGARLEATNWGEL